MILPFKTNPTDKKEGHPSRNHTLPEVSEASGLTRICTQDGCPGKEWASGLGRDLWHSKADELRAGRALLSADTVQLMLRVQLHLWSRLHCRSMSKGSQGRWLALKHGGPRGVVHNP